MRFVCRLLLLVLLCALSSVAQTDSSPQAAANPASDDAQWQRYQHILRGSTLEWQASQPFVLKIDYQLYDLDGKPAVKGTAEESWGENEGKQIRIQSPTLNLGDAPLPDEIQVHNRERYLVLQVLGALARPFPEATQRKDFAMTEIQRTIEGAESDCFFLRKPGRAADSDSDENDTYCVDANNHIVAITGHLFVLQRSDFREQRGHVIPMKMLLSYEGKPALSAEVTELDPLPDERVNQNKTKTTWSSKLVSSDVINGLALKQKRPSYPNEARKRHLTGEVLLIAIITKQGKIAGLDVIASPDPAFSKTARDAVQKWTYKPYVVEGVPTELDTSIRIAFSIGN